MVLWTVNLIKRGDSCTGEDVGTLNKMGLPNHSGKISEVVKFHWLPPDKDEVKANMDGSVQGEPLAAGIGVSFRNKEGDFLMVIAIRIEITDIVWAESIAIIRAAEVVVEKG